MRTFLLLLLPALLLGFAHPAPAQTHPAAPAATSPEARQARYLLDLTQQLREVYQAPSDGRAISLLSNIITEFTARKKALLAEAQAVRPPRPLATGRVEPPTDGAAKMAARRRRNPALEYTFRRFDQAQLTTLAAFSAE